jgi:hypothetical protein
MSEVAMMYRHNTDDSIQSAARLVQAQGKPLTHCIMELVLRYTPAG